MWEKKRNKVLDREVNHSQQNLALGELGFVDDSYLKGDNGKCFVLVCSCSFISLKFLFHWSVADQQCCITFGYSTK